MEVYRCSGRAGRLLIFDKVLAGTADRLWDAPLLTRATDLNRQLGPLLAP